MKLKKKVTLHPTACQSVRVVRHRAVISTNKYTNTKLTRSCTKRMNARNEEKRMQGIYVVVTSIYIKFCASRYTLEPREHIS